MVKTRDERVGERLAVRRKITVISTMATLEGPQLLHSYLPSSVDVAVDRLELLVKTLDHLPLAIMQ